MITDDMVEAGARALHDDMRSSQNYVRLWEDTGDEWKDAKRRQARAVLEAAYAGRVVIPRPLVATHNPNGDHLVLTFRTEADLSEAMKELTDDAG